MLLLCNGKAAGLARDTAALLRREICEQGGLKQNERTAPGPRAQRHDNPYGSNLLQTRAASTPAAPPVPRTRSGFGRQTQSGRLVRSGRVTRGYQDLPPPTR